jgi:hypothetical protein
MKSVHCYVGIAIVILFLFSGLYMRQHAAELLYTNDVIRFMSRANHIYILLCGLLNLIMGIYFVPATQKWRKRLQIFGSVLILSAPILLIPAFFLEPPHASPTYRTLTVIGVWSLLLGALCHVPSRNVK